MTIEDITVKVAKKPTRARHAMAVTVPTPVPITASKSDTVIKLLQRAKGATPVELVAATEWQPHSVRAYLSGLRKKGRVLVREARKSGEFAYRIVATKPVPTDLAATVALPTILSVNASS